jgi:hypothetical protein
MQLRVPLLGVWLARARSSRWSLASCVLGAALGLAGCSFETGDDFRVTVTWLINGTAPSDALCRENGVDRVRLSVSGPGAERVVEADCDETIYWDGWSYGGFETTRSFDYGVEYDYRVDMLDSSGRTLPDLGYNDSFKVYYGDEVPWVLAPLELFSPEGSLAAVSAAWTVDRTKPTSASCAELGAVTVAIDVASSTDENFDDAVEVAHADCSTGAIETVNGVLAEGEYLVRYVALDSDDDVVQEIIIDGPPFLVDTRGTLEIPIVDFEL